MLAQTSNPSANLIDLIVQDEWQMLRGGPVFRNRMAAWLRWILGWVTPPISPRLPA